MAKNAAAGSASKGKSPGKVLASKQGQAKQSFNRAGSQTVPKYRTTQVNAVKRSGYTIVPTAGVKTPQVGKAFQRAAKKPVRLSKPVHSLELNPPGKATKKDAVPSTAQKINTAKIPLVQKKETRIQEFAAAMAKKKSKAKSKGGNSR